MKPQQPKVATVAVRVSALRRSPSGNRRDGYLVWDILTNGKVRCRGFHREESGTAVPFEEAFPEAVLIAHLFVQASAIEAYERNHAAGPVHDITCSGLWAFGGHRPPRREGTS